MKIADKPENEKQRLEALYRYQILDTEAEKVFDDLTELASEICGTPIALISLVDPDRQWFKSKVGIDAEETSRDIAFCAHAIHQKEIFEVSDTHLDERFFDNPLVTEEPNIRFYAGMPLETPEGMAIGTLCTISDQPKTLTHQQRKSLAILGREVVSQLELRLKIRQVEEANQRKTDFMSSLSHELRTPLNAIISFSQLMQNDKSVQLPDHYYQYLRHMDFSGKRLLELINSVLDVNKIESGKLTLNPKNIDINNFFDSIHAIARTLADDNSVQLVFSFAANSVQNVELDEARLSQIILNLISNAVKFTPAGKSVSVNIVIDNNVLVIAIKDQGIGIAKEDMPLLFGKFQQVGERAGKEGAGLGLMITKSLVELMSGTIKINSELNEGTLVKVSLPVTLAPTSEPPTKTVLMPETINTSTKVLLVEDNDINQEVAKAIFESIGLSIDIAENGETALQKINNQQYDIIFMDIHLPGMDGYETSAQIKSLIPEQKIIALTADVFAQNQQKLHTSGISDVLTKPIEKSKVVSILNHYCPSS
ncbi:GAF domain-containing hybrid sensor histidine kinase/response regulator [Aliiglaciecola lipolytica]|uniref:histidine kinase n=1 Tax=Aliiglaciecola lipolytica E3 TaxID=1127673 RepID=K6Y949_9ALTE|nr:GAF domain-containing hybrid sensor histidine kinase/response regulator [Aliiglaciecola lipolytica]GAC13193.1 histidine kinase response regulator hybrid protein [Aliiglaciecola lipolytica E3]